MSDVDLHQAAQLAGNAIMSHVKTHSIKLGVTGIFKDLQVRRMLGTLLLLLMSFAKQGEGSFNKSIPLLHPRQVETKQFSSGPSPPGPLSAVNASPSAANASLTNLFQAQKLDDISPTQDPTWPNCKDLTIAILPSFIDAEYPVEWTLTSSQFTYNKNYSDPALFNTVVIDSLSDDGFCLTSGDYLFNISSIGIAYYLLYSEEEVLECGGLFKDSQDYDISLPFDQTNAESTCPALINCQGVDNATECLIQAFAPLQCYTDGIEVDITAADYNSMGNRTFWFSDTCSPILNELCESSVPMLGFGAGYESPSLQERSVVDKFCPYFACASASFERFINGGTLDEYYGCECKYTHWACGKSPSLFRDLHFAHRLTCIMQPRLEQSVIWINVVWTMT